MILELMLYSLAIIMYQNKSHLAKNDFFFNSIVPAGWG